MPTPALKKDKTSATRKNPKKKALKTLLCVILIHFCMFYPGRGGLEPTCLQHPLDPTKSRAIDPIKTRLHAARGQILGSSPRMTWGYVQTGAKGAAYTKPDHAKFRDTGGGRGGIELGLPVGL
jgi:hypothetical protein